MVKLYEKAEIRQRLRTDPAWSAYALSDLDESRFPHSRWLGLPDDSSIALLYCEFPAPVFFYHGSTSSLDLLLPHVPLPPGTHLQLKPEAMRIIAGRTEIAWSKPMVRMKLDRLSPLASGAVALDPAHAEELAALYSDGEPAGESPDFYFSSMLEDGCFFGVWHNDVLAAAAGTHIVSTGESTAAIGNVYTHRDYRSRGYASAATAAVAQALLAATIRTIILNVAAHNTAALRVYRKLGFVPHCDFFEALTR
ncbi:MAG: GNAT family N-acetyltransferase [Bryobacterales bacterium]|nr:GNAT family N-acetyltransferase [Bryobacterales bacterium]